MDALRTAREPAPQVAVPAAEPHPVPPAPPPAELAALLELSRALRGARDRASLYAAVARGLAPLPSAERIVALVGEDGWLDAWTAGEAPVALPRRRDDAQASALAWVARERRMLVVSSTEQVGDGFTDVHRRLARRLGQDGMQSAAVLPLVANARTTGALALLSRTSGAWDGASPWLLGELGDAVAVALESCLHHERQRRLNEEATALLDVNRAIGRHLDRDELFGALAECLRSVVPTERFGIELPIEGDRLQGHLLTPQLGCAGPTQPTVLPAPGTACDWVLRSGEWVVTAEREELRERFPITFEVMEREAMQSLCALPLVTGDRCRAVLFFMSAARGVYRDLRRDFLDRMAGSIAVALDDCLAHEEVSRLRDQLEAENVYLQEEIREDFNFGEIVGNSPALRRVMSLVERAAPTDATVLILGETGTGKELIARAIHDKSRRRHRPLVKVNCAAISAGLVESELFGHVRGAFTGAIANRTGRFELADGGTIFLDEVGEVPLETQAKLLRVLQEREFEAVGTSRAKTVDVRVIAATNRNLEQAVAEGRFRPDLFYRLNVLPIRVPPLRERREDIPLLAACLAARSARQMAKRVEGLSRRTVERLLAYDWPGNVRELQNVVERAVVLAKGPVLEVEAETLLAAPIDEPPLRAAPGRATTLRSATAPETAPATAPETARGVGASVAAGDLDPPRALHEVARQHVHGVLERCAWVIEGPNGAAHALGLKPSTLRSRMKKMGLERRPA